MAGVLWSLLTDAHDSSHTAGHTVVKFGVIIPTLNNIISLVCGIMIFSLTFHTFYEVRDPPKALC